MTLVFFRRQKRTEFSSKYKHDNDPKYTSICLKEWFLSNKIKLLKWPAHKFDEDSIENLCGNYIPKYIVHYL